MKKFATVALSVGLIGAMVAGGSLAYLSDTASDVNVMTLGNVNIEQHEYQRAEENGAYKTATIDEQTSYVLEGFKQGKELLPIVGDPSTGAAGWDNTIVRMSQVDSYGSMQVFAGKNAQDKFVTVENTGKTDAYVRTLVAIEVGAAADKAKNLVEKDRIVIKTGDLSIENIYLPESGDRKATSYISVTIFDFDKLNGETTTNEVKPANNDELPF